jgi:hypothetical protein
MTQPLMNPRVICADGEMKSGRSAKITGEAARQPITVRLSPYRPASIPAGIVPAIPPTVTAPIIFPRESS